MSTQPGLCAIIPERPIRPLHPMFEPGSEDLHGPAAARSAEDITSIGLLLSEHAGGVSRRKHFHVSAASKKLCDKSLHLASLELG